MKKSIAGIFCFLAGILSVGLFVGSDAVADGSPVHKCADNEYSPFDGKCAPCVKGNGLLVSACITDEAECKANSSHGDPYVWKDGKCYPAAVPVGPVARLELDPLAPAEPPIAECAEDEWEFLPGDCRSCAPDINGHSDPACLKNESACLEPTGEEYNLSTGEWDTYYLNKWEDGECRPRPVSLEHPPQVVDLVFPNRNCDFLTHRDVRTGEPCGDIEFIEVCQPGSGQITVVYDYSHECECPEGQTYDRPNVKCVSIEPEQSVVPNKLTLTPDEASIPASTVSVAISESEDQPEPPTQEVSVSVSAPASVVVSVSLERITVSCPGSDGDALCTQLSPASTITTAIPPPPIECGFGYFLDNGECRPPQNSEECEAHRFWLPFYEDGECVDRCSAGKRYDYDLDICRDRVQSDCPNNYVLNAERKCECTGDYEIDYPFENSTTRVCSPVCEEGQVRDRQRNCVDVEPETPVDNTEPPADEEVGGFDEQECIDSGGIVVDSDATNSGKACFYPVETNDLTRTPEDVQSGPEAVQKAAAQLGVAQASYAPVQQISPSDESRLPEYAAPAALLGALAFSSFYPDYELGSSFNYSGENGSLDWEAGMRGDFQHGSFSSFVSAVQSDNGFVIESGTTYRSDSFLASYTTVEAKDYMNYAVQLSAPWQHRGWEIKPNLSSEFHYDRDENQSNTNSEAGLDLEYRF